MWIAPFNTAGSSDQRLRKCMEQYTLFGLAANSMAQGLLTRDYQCIRLWYNFLAVNRSKQVDTQFKQDNRLTDSLCT